MVQIGGGKKDFTAKNEFILLPSEYDIFSPIFNLIFNFLFLCSFQTTSEDATPGRRIGARIWSKGEDLWLFGGDDEFGSM